MDTQTKREKMVTEQIMARGIRDAQVLRAMRKVPRHLFVDPPLQKAAYEDRPLPISSNQTISQPYIVALMTAALDLNGNEKVLEIGSGSGYQCAILAEICRQVYTVERHAELLQRARKILDRLEYTNIFYHLSNGSLGWAENAPYDAVIVTAGAPEVPATLVEQLADGGRLVVPVGNRISQELTKIIKHNGHLEQKSLGGCQFVRLVGSQGWQA